MRHINERFCSSDDKAVVNKYRGNVEKICMRAETILTGKKLSLVRLYFDRGASCRELADITGMSEAQVWRWLIDTIELLFNVRNLFFLRHKELFTPLEQSIIYAVIFQELSLAQTAKRNRTSLHYVRAALDKLKHLERKHRKGQKCR